MIKKQFIKVANRSGNVLSINDVPFCLLCGKDPSFGVLINFPFSAIKLVAFQPVMEFGSAAVPLCRYLESNLYTCSDYELNQADLQQS